MSSTQIYAASDPTRPREVVNLVPLRIVGAQPEPWRTSGQRQA